MRRIYIVIFLLLCISAMAEERVEMLPFGNMDTWTVRYIKESQMLGGKTKTLYAIAPTDTIRVNKAFECGVNGNPWSCSNAYANVGVVKGSCSVEPEVRGNGYCARLEAKIEEVKCIGIDISVMVSGTLFLGKTLEPVGMKGGMDPYSVIDIGVPFTGHPTALMLDYKAIVENNDTITIGKVMQKRKYVRGKDCAEVYVYLQHRWEDARGNIYARRVGTAYEQIWHTIPNWVNDHRIPIRWGDITMQKGYKDYEKLGGHVFRAQNSKGKMVPIQEIAYGLEQPTHIVMMFTASSYEAFSGHEGNTLWVDNVRLVYDDKK